MHPVQQFLQDVHLAGEVGTVETSHYSAIVNLLNASGDGLSPRVRAVAHPRASGAGIADVGLFTVDQLGGDEGWDGSLLPARGVVEVKGLSHSIVTLAQSEQVARYAKRYGQVLATNVRDWVLVEPGEGGAACVIESYSLTDDEASFRAAARDARDTAEEQGDLLLDFLRRVMLRPAPLREPKDLAWLLASYARDARWRLERTDLPSLDALREALEESLGITFQDKPGDRFFRSTLVQTLFYGVFSAWVLWARDRKPGDRFDWQKAVWHLKVPMISSLYEQIATPTRLERMDLTDVLGRVGEALDRVQPEEFFSRFREDRAVQYFYEPFLEAFDPELRKELGVWYTPPEVVTYMVERVDRVLRSELGIADGLADPDVVVLDPCCGTGAYVVEVLERIGRTLRDEKGEDALVGAELRRAATERVFGFEILPAPFVVAHLQIGLLLQSLGQSSEERERVGVYLTNALTGWTDEEANQQLSHAFPGLAEEHDAAEGVKRNEKVLVVLGNPPYNGYPGIAIGEERDLVDEYRKTKRAPKPQGQGLNDLYVRFFRMAERRIVEMTGRGIVCFISNYSWLDRASHTGMRERYQNVFDCIWIDSLNGDKYRTGKLTPQGEPDPSIFSTDCNSEGIQVGTAVTLLCKKFELRDIVEACELLYRDFWGVAKRQDLIDALGQSDNVEPYRPVTTSVEIGLPFRPSTFTLQYTRWPKIVDVFPARFSGVQTSRDALVVGMNAEDISKRMADFFDEKLSLTEIARRHNIRSPIGDEEWRKAMSGKTFQPKNIAMSLYRPFDVRHLYWDTDTNLLNRPRNEYRPYVQDSNLWLTCTPGSRKRSFYQPQVTRLPIDYNVIEGSVKVFPLWLADPTDEGHDAQHSFLERESEEQRDANLSDEASGYLTTIDAAPEDLFHHAVAMLHAPDYRAENAGALRQDWPRVPLPDDRVHLLASADLGRELAALLDPERPVDGVTSGAVHPELRVVARVVRAGDGQIDPDRDLALTAGWGHAGARGVTMPGRGRYVERAYTGEERAALETGAVRRETSEDQLLALLGETCVDVWLNDEVCWRCVPLRVWEYTLGGYQVIKKWLSYREKPLLGRDLRMDEVREVTAIARRIASILLVEPALDAAYAAVKASPYAWPER